MTSLLKIWLVKYQCSCSAWYPLCQLHFCRKCAKLKCPICVVEEMDTIFCPYCLENISQTEALQRRFRCQVCNECPMCGNLLGVRSQSDLYYLQCNACQWTTRDLGVPDRRTSNEPWPEPLNPLDEELGKVMNIVKGLSNFERLERERKAQTTKRLSNLGILQNDRFGLQNAYNMRKKIMHQRPEPMEKLTLLAPSGDVPELDPDFFNVAPDPGSTLGLEQIISHPVLGSNSQLFPTKVKMISRRAFRCSDCDTMLYKGELSPNVVKPRMQCFAIDFFPDVKISREVQLTPGHNSAFFLSITNNTAQQMEVKLTGLKCEEDASCVDVSNFAMDLTMAKKVNSPAENPDESSQVVAEYRSDPNEIRSRVVHVSRNVTGICVECLVPDKIEHSQNYALFSFTFTLQSETQEYKGQLRINLC